MPHPTGPSNENTRKLIAALRKSKNDAVARRLSMPSRSRKAVNIQRIAKLSGKFDTFAVPGKVLGLGVIDKPVSIYALSFSKEAMAKIAGAKGKALPLSSLPEKSKARLVI